MRTSLATCIALLGIIFTENLLCAQDPLKLLLITGGCCHDYPYQSSAMEKALKERSIPAQWKVINEGGSGTRAEIDLYKNADWAKGYDVVIHNECFADTNNEDYIRSITKAHRDGANAVVIHCAMHTYRTVTFDDWREMLGVTSRRHDPQSIFKVKPLVKDHPIMKNFPAEWTTPMDELYIIEKLWPNATALATSVSKVDGKEYPVIWTNQIGKARVFGTTFGHGNATFDDKVYIETLVQGILWSAGRLAAK